MKKEDFRLIINLTGRPILFLFSKLLNQLLYQKDHELKRCHSGTQDQEVLTLYSVQHCRQHASEVMHCYVMVMIWHDPFSLTKALASVVVWGFGGHSGSTKSSWARYMYFAFGIFFLQSRTQDKQHFPQWSTDS